MAKNKPVNKLARRETAVEILNYITTERAKVVDGMESENQHGARLALEVMSDRIRKHFDVMVR